MCQEIGTQEYWAALCVGLQDIETGKQTLIEINFYIGLDFSVGTKNCCLVERFESTGLFMKRG